METWELANSLNDCRIALRNVCAVLAGATAAHRESCEMRIGDLQAIHVMASSADAALAICSRVEETLTYVSGSLTYTKDEEVETGDAA